MYVFCFELLPKSDEHLLCRRRESKTDHHLRPPRLRRSSAAHHASPSGQHSLPGGELPGATPPPASARLIGADAIRHPGQSGCHTKKSPVTDLYRSQKLDFLSLTFGISSISQGILLIIELYWVWQVATNNKSEHTVYFFISTMYKASWLNVCISMQQTSSIR